MRMSAKAGVTPGANASGSRLSCNRYDPQSRCVFTGFHLHFRLIRARALQGSD